MPSCAAMAPIAQHRGGDAQLACDLDQRPTAARQQGDRLPLELIRKMTPFLTHSTPFRSHRSLAKVSTNSGEAHSVRAGSCEWLPRVEAHRLIVPAMTSSFGGGVSPARDSSDRERAMTGLGRFSVSASGGDCLSLALLGRVMGVVAVALAPAARDTAVAGIGRRARGRSGLA